MSCSLGLGGISHCTSEDILVLHFGEVHTIVSMRMRVLCGIVSVIDPSTITSQVLGLAVSPILDLEVRDRAAFVIVGHGHCSLVGLVVNSLSS